MTFSETKDCNFKIKCYNLFKLNFLKQHFQLKNWQIKMKLWQQIFLGMALGILSGILFKENTKYIKPLGDIFISMIKMIVVPLIFFSIVSAITSMEQSHSLGRIGLKTISIYILTTIIAVTIGLVLANVFNPAEGLENTDIFGYKATTAVDTSDISISKIITSIIPSNPIAAMAEGNVLQIIIFALFLGTAIKITGRRAGRIADSINDMAEIMYSLTSLVMKFAPVGVFTLIAWVVGTQDPEILRSLVRMVLVVIGACILHMLVVYSLLITFFARLNPLRFFRKIIDAQLLAFSTSSSSATLPVTIKVAKEKLGVSRNNARFILPLGSTVNMDGTAIYLGISAVFVSSLIGHELTFGNYAVIILTATLSSIGAAGIPGVALIVMSIVFSAVGLPIEAIAVIAGVDRLLDMVRTTVNVTGDLAVSVVVDRSEKSFNQNIFNNTKLAIRNRPADRNNYYNKNNRKFRNKKRRDHNTYNKPNS